MIGKERGIDSVLNVKLELVAAHELRVHDRGPATVWRASRFVCIQQHVNGGVAVAVDKDLGIALIRQLHDCVQVFWRHDRSATPVLLAARTAGEVGSVSYT